MGGQLSVSFNFFKTHDTADKVALCTAFEKLMFDIADIDLNGKLDELEIERATYGFSHEKTKRNISKKEKDGISIKDVYACINAHNKAAIGNWEALDLEPWKTATKSYFHQDSQCDELRIKLKDLLQNNIASKTNAERDIELDKIQSELKECETILKKFDEAVKQQSDIISPILHEIETRERIVDSYSEKCDQHYDATSNKRKKN